MSKKCITKKSGICVSTYIYSPKFHRICVHFTYIHSDISTCYMWLKLWKALWFSWVFWVFSYIFEDILCLNYCISTKLSLIGNLINTDISICRMWLQVMEHIDIFIHYWGPFMSEVFYLHQTFTDCMSVGYFGILSIVCYCLSLARLHPCSRISDALCLIKYHKNYRYVW